MTIIVAALLGWLIGYFVHDRVAARVATARGKTRVVQHRSPHRAARPRAVDSDRAGA